MSCFQPSNIVRKRIEPSSMTLKYGLGLVLVALVMVLLAVAYISMIALLVYGVVYQFRHHHYLIGMGGSVLAFFLVKPLLARRLPEPNRFSLTAKSDPELFQLIARISELVGVPFPSRVDVDCVPNATASYRDGWRSIRGNDLVLTIGLPLAEALTVEELAGVIAHELGHFSQRHGMRLTYIIRSLNRWFARVVYERDTWDALLTRMAHGIDPRIGLFFVALRICIWLSRRILWAFMQLGHVFDCFMLRQMEFDADSYEAKVAGSAAFVKTHEKLRSLSAASALVMKSVQESWRKRRLPDNLPGFINFSTDYLTPELQKKVKEAATKTRTGIFDTHPRGAARAQAAVELRQPGIINDKSPAGRLFNNLAGLNKMATRYFYEGTFELEISDKHLFSHEAEAREKRMKLETEKNLHAFLFEVRSTYRPILLKSPLPTETGVKELIQMNVHARKAMDQMRASAVSADREMEEAELLLQRGLDALVQGTQQATGLATARMDAMLPILTEFESLAGTRLASVLALLNQTAFCQKVKDAAEWQKQLEMLVPVYIQLCRAFYPLQELRRKTVALNMALNIPPRDQRAALARARVAELVPLIQNRMAGIKALLQELPESCRTLENDATLTDLAKSDIPTAARPHALVSYSRRMTDGLLPLERYVLGRLTWIALKVEACVESQVTA
jgi:Zn-dependent protease with chaperone function